MRTNREILYHSLLIQSTQPMRTYLRSLALNRTASHCLGLLRVDSRSGAKCTVRYAIPTQEPRWSRLYGVKNILTDD